MLADDGTSSLAVGLICLETGCVKRQLYNHQHVIELYLNVGERKRAEHGKYHRKEQTF